MTESGSSCGSTFKDEGYNGVVYGFRADCVEEGLGLGVVVWGPILNS